MTSPSLPVGILGDLTGIRCANPAWCDRRGSPTLLAIVAQRARAVGACLLVAAGLGGTTHAAAQPLAAQLRHPRVRSAQLRRGAEVRALFTRQGLPYPPKALFMRVFKEDDALELWARPADKEPFVLVKELRICARSGSLGPKRREGDLQVPEGFYVINMLNPNSTYHLSLGLSYPNASDRILGERGALGGAIFIHGSCVTIGCLPMTDEGIEELYLSALAARQAGQAEIPVHVFPARLTDAALARLTEAARDNPGLARFWSGLKPGYDAFEKSRRVPRVTVARDGSYQVSAGR